MAGPGKGGDEPRIGRGGEAVSSRRTRVTSPFTLCKSGVGEPVWGPLCFMRASYGIGTSIVFDVRVVVEAVKGHVYRHPSVRFRYD